MSTIIKAESLGKKYVLQHEHHERYTALRDVITRKAKGMLRSAVSPFLRRGSTNANNGKREDLWALRDVSFEVEQGEAVGIIGRNGAGKSTLLKILSRITEPTEGRVSLKGRVASLLEVGTGFHPELTGRENIYLNGAILGMSRAEIKDRFDEIVDFAEIEKFLDTPVKRYSSGMYVRLAFAVAAHLEPEILLVDEVLAVGDAEFQKKCLGKMGETIHGGRTVLFVSHNMGAVQALCTSALMLRSGRVEKASKDVRGVIREYLFCQDDLSSEWINGTRGKFRNPWFAPTRIAVTDRAGERLQMPVANDAETWIRIEGEIQEIDPALTVGYAIYSEEGHLLYWSYQTDQPEKRWPKLRKGCCTLTSKVPNRLLNQGKYRIELIASLHFRQWLIEPGKDCPAVHLTIEGGLSDSPYWMDRRPGLLGLEVEWLEG